MSWRQSFEAWFIHRAAKQSVHKAQMVWQRDHPDSTFYAYLTKGPAHEIPTFQDAIVVIFKLQEQLRGELEGKLNGICPLEKGGHPVRVKFVNGDTPMLWWTAAHYAQV